MTVENGMIRIKIELYKFIHRIYRCDTHAHFQRQENRNTRGHSLKIEKGHHRLQVRGNFFSVRIINILEEVVTAPSVNAFKSRLDKLWIESPTMYDPECYH